MPLIMSLNITKQYNEADAYVLNSGKILDIPNRTYYYAQWASLSFSHHQGSSL